MTKVGTEMTIRVRKSRPVSTDRPRRSPLTTPRTIPMITSMTTATRVSRRVTGKAVDISSSTGWPLKAVPKSPRKIWPM